MSYRRVVLAIPTLTVLALSGCSSGSGVDFVAKHEPWRETEENACLAARAVRTSQFVRVRSSLGGPSYCGSAHPFEMAAALGGRVALHPPALLRCPMIPQVERWIGQTVAPAARYYFGADLAEVTVAGSYSCRPINHVSGGKLSEHGYANALDVSGFKLTDGRKITVKSGWYGAPQERAFLRDVHRAGCKEFTTVLGPEANRLHRDHFHLDLARHGQNGTKSICR